MQSSGFFAVLLMLFPYVEKTCNCGTSLRLGMLYNASYNTACYFFLVLIVDSNSNMSQTRYLFISFLKTVIYFFPPVSN